MKRPPKGGFFIPVELLWGEVGEIYRLFKKWLETQNRAFYEWYLLRSCW